MKIALTFDDGRKDSYIASKIMFDCNLKGTFYVTTGFIDGTLKTNAFGKNRESLSVEDLKKMNEMNMEISSHSDSHIMTTDDFKTSIKKLCKFGIHKSDCKIGFSIPNSKYSKNELKEFVNDNSDQLMYVRAGRDQKCYSLFSKMLYVLFHLFKFQFLYNNFNCNNVVKEKDLEQFLIPSIVIKKDIRAKNIIKFIEKNKEKDSIIVFMFHSIVEKPKDKWEWNINDFKMLCNFLSLNKNVECDTLLNIVSAVIDKRSK